MPKNIDGNNFMKVLSVLSSCWCECLQLTNSVTDWLTDSVEEQSPSWEANSHSASQGIPQLLWNLMVYYHIHKSPPLVPILSQMHPVHSFPPCFPKIHSDIILPSILRSAKCSLPFRFSDQSNVCIYLFLACYMSRPSHPPLFVHPNNIWQSVQVMKLVVMQFSPAFRYILLLTSKFSPQDLFSNTIHVPPLE
jgi:hypothetical protein